MACKVLEGGTGTASSNQKPIFIAASYPAKNFFGFTLGT